MQRRQQQGPGFGFGLSSLDNMFDDPFFASGPFSSDPFFANAFGNMFGQQRGSLFGGLAFPQPPTAFPGVYKGHDLDMMHTNDMHGWQQTDTEGFAAADIMRRHGGDEKRGKQEPIVEHPDSEDEGLEEEESHENRASQQSRAATSLDDGRSREGFTRRSSYQPVSVTQDLMRNPGGIFDMMATTSSSSYVFQSSTVTYSGIGGQSYHSSSSARRMAGNGVYEEQHTARDSTGRQHLTLTRGLGNKARTVSRTRHGESDSSFEVLHNIAQDEAATFDRQWQYHASSGLPAPPGRQSRHLALPFGQQQASEGYNTVGRGRR